jgi:photosystem II stability/assembly factor-like uncharacterized protein
MKAFLIPITIIVGILIIAGIILSTSSPLQIPSLSLGSSNSNSNSNSRVSGAVFKSIDGGRTFESKSQVKDGLKINLDKNVISLGFGDDKILVALTRSGGLFRSDNWGENWDAVFNSPVTANTFGVNRNNPNEIYIGAVFGKRARLYKTTQGGKDNSWQEVYVEPKSGTVFVSLRVDPRNDSIIYGLLSSGVLLKSYNKGQDWVLASDLSTSVLGMELDNRNPNNIIVVGTQALYTSQDGGFTFVDSTPKLKSRPVTGSQITSFAINPNNFREIYIGSTGELIRSDDGGLTWNILRILTPDLTLPISNVSISPSQSNIVYYTVNSVLYTSYNRGESWNTTDLSSALSSISSLLIDRQKSDILYISTN